MHMKRMMQGWTDPHLSSANMSLCITLFPDPNVSKPGLRREHSLTGACHGVDHSKTVDALQRADALEASLRQ